MTSSNKKVQQDKPFQEKQQSFSDPEVVTILLDLKEEVKAMQSNLASLRPDIISLLAGRWKDERTRRRERCW